jgi:hypothetical protein
MRGYRGVIRTPMWDRILEPQREALENRFVTGTVLTVDGGLVLTGN